MKNIKLRNVPKVESKLLAKDLAISEQLRKAQDPAAKGILDQDTEDTGIIL